MGLQDFETFIRERLRVYDENLDLTSGSPIDTQVIQPLLRRIGTDPFTIDASTFIIERLSQEFPDLASSDGDAVSDLLAKPALLLWDPIIREIQRVKNSLSFRDPSTLTVDEADALGANLFAKRNKGDYARGVGRIYFAQPQPIAITQSNFFTSRAGLHYFPTGVQSIKAEEMILNVEGDLYYFDVNLIAESTGDNYNIGPSELVTIANVGAAVRVTNKVRFRAGVAETDAVTFIGDIEKSLSERSLVTTRGISARLTESFSEITRLNVVGMGDPEMQRDVLSGGGLGPMLAFGADAQAAPDGEFKPRTRRVTMPSGAFLSTIGPAGPIPPGWVLTLFNAFGANPPAVRDLEVSRVINDQTLEVTSQVIWPQATGAAWALRKRELTLSGIPGGILFPDSPTGTVTVESDRVHIGGCTDMFVRGASFDTSSFQIDSASDEKPLLSGTQAQLSEVSGVGFIVLGDYVLGDNSTPGNYASDDETDALFNRAGFWHFAIEVLDGPGAGVYRVMQKLMTVVGASPVFYVQPVPSATFPGTYRWRLLDQIHIDLVEPKETRVSGASGKTIQNVSAFSTSSVPAIDFSALGVSAGDTLRILSGPDKGDRTVEAISPPFYTELVVDRPFTNSVNNVPFTVFRQNKAGGIKRPLLRITEVGLLDTGGQPVGSTVPYAKPVGIRSNSFQNPGSGIKQEFSGAQLGIVSRGFDWTGPFGATVSFGVGGNLVLAWVYLTSPLNVPLSGTMQLTAVVNAINAVAQASAEVGYSIASVIRYGSNDYIGIVPAGMDVTTSGTTAAVATSLFGDTDVRTSRDVRYYDSASSSWFNWSYASPAVDSVFDALWVKDGLQPGFYGKPSPSMTGEALQCAYDFAPEVSVSIRLGSRSLGSARLYFLEPTSMEVDANSVFTTVDANNNILNFSPDPSLTRQVYPALPNGTKPKNGSSDSSTIFSSAGVDFIRKGVRNRDILRIDYVPLKGNFAGGLQDPIPGLAATQLRISLNDQSDKLVIFVNDVSTPGAVSRKGVADQINAAVGLNICSIEQIGLLKQLVFNPTSHLILRQQSSNPSSANSLLGFSNSTDTDNKSKNAGDYFIISVAPAGDPSELLIDPPMSYPSPDPSASSQQFSIIREGEQRICSTNMSKQQTSGSLYYWDVELVSEGPGDLWNIGADQEMLVSSYRSDGYYLTTDDPNLSLSTAESVGLVLSSSVLEVGVDDDPDNATQLVGQSLSISYEYSSLVQNVQSFVGAETERVINESALARSLVPHYVRFDMTYLGGSKPAEVLPYLEDHIQSLRPDVALESSDVQAIVANKGATYIQNPVDLMAVVYNVDRTVALVRSQDALTTGRLAAFIPDIINLTRKTS